MFLTEKIDENPLETAKIILNIALKFRQSSVLYSDNILFLEHVAQFATFHKNDKKILETCINAIGEFGGLSKDENCKWFCFNFLKSFKNDEDKKNKVCSKSTYYLSIPRFFHARA